MLLGHMGGPLWARKDDHAWSFPKGLVEAGEDPWRAAQREFHEETGMPVPSGPVSDLGQVRAGGKTIRLWRVDAEPDLAAFRPGHFTMEWPPRSGVERSFPEIDRIAWVAVTDARRLLTRGQQPFLDRLTRS